MAGRPAGIDLLPGGCRYPGKNVRRRDGGWKRTRRGDRRKRFAGFHYRDGHPKFIGQQQNRLITRQQQHKKVETGVTQSTMRMRSNLCLIRSCLAAMATELKKQNPMAC